jgi:hypothetical protein
VKLSSRMTPSGPKSSQRNFSQQLKEPADIFSKSETPCDYFAGRPGQPGDIMRVATVISPQGCLTSFTGISGA